MISIEIEYSTAGDKITNINGKYCITTGKEAEIMGSCIQTSLKFFSTPEEPVGKTHVLWEVDVKDEVLGWCIDFPQYTDGSLCCHRTGTDVG